jgi:hypothetical protein
MVMIKPEGTVISVRQVGNDVSPADFHLTALQSIGLNPSNRRLDGEGINQQDRTNNPIKIRSGYNSHEWPPYASFSPKIIVELLYLDYTRKS